MAGLSSYATDGFYYADTFDGRLFISGGRDCEGKLHEARWIDEVSMRLESRMSMINARSRHCMTYISGNYLMATGGIENYTVTKKCEMYAIDHDSWSVCEPMNEARRNHSAVEAKDGVLYVFCGIGEEGHFSGIERFTRSGNLWELIETDIQIPVRSDPGLVAINSGEQLVIFGGSGSEFKPLADVFTLHTGCNRI